MRIAIVNDLPMATEVLRRILISSSSHTIIWMAKNGREAVEMCAKDRPDLILMDLMMPVMDGWAFRQIQREDPKLSHIPVLVLSADGGARERVQALGAVAFLRKPVQLDALLDAVSDTASKRRAD